MTMRACLIMLTGTILISACTTQIKTAIYDKSNIGAASGPSYYLPKQSVSVEVTYQLVSCSVNDPVGGTDVYQIKKTAKLALKNVADGSAHYVLDQYALSSGLKTTEIKLETYPNGTLKSVGASVDDRTAEAAGSALDFAGKVVNTALAGTLNDKTIQCKRSADGRTPVIADQLAAMYKLRTDLRNPALYTDEEARAAAVDALARLEAFFTIKRTFSFTPTRAANGLAKTDLFPAASQVFSKWLQGSDLPTDDTFKALTRTTVCVAPGATSHAATTTYTGEVNATIDGTAKKICDKAIKLAASSAPSGTDPIKGLPHRDPASVTVIACKGLCVGTDTKIIGATRGFVSQLGLWRALRLKSENFQDRNLAATFAENGLMTSYTYGASADLESLAATAAKFADTASSALEANRDENLNAIKRETALLEAKAAKIEAETKLNGLQEPEASTDDDNAIDGAS